MKKQLITNQEWSRKSYRPGLPDMLLPQAVCARNKRKFEIDVESEIEIEQDCD